MDQDVRKHFETVIRLAHDHLQEVSVVQNDVTASRAILEIHGVFRNADVRIKEIFSATGNWYSYYLLRQGVVVVGFDNYPDLVVIKTKFGRQYKKYLGKPVPHRHGLRKKTVQATAEIDAEEFLDRLAEFAET